MRVSTSALVLPSASGQLDALPLTLAPILVIVARQYFKKFDNMASDPSMA